MEGGDLQRGQFSEKGLSADLHGTPHETARHARRPEGQIIAIRSISTITGTCSRSEGGTEELVTYSVGGRGVMAPSVSL